MTPWRIRYEEHVVREDIKGLDRTIKNRIRKAIDQKLTQDPQHFGKPLRYSLNSLRSLRVGDYRVLYAIDREKALVSIVSIAHRRHVYDDK